MAMLKNWTGILLERTIKRGQKVEEKQELGRLRLEKIKWDKSIEAAIAAVQFCHKQNKQVTKKELEEHLRT
jgi:hypothetical protein